MVSHFLVFRNMNLGLLVSKVSLVFFMYLFKENHWEIDVNGQDDLRLTPLHLFCNKNQKKLTMWHTRDHPLLIGTQC